jgi:adenine-specific DNA-methyltransferase
MATPQTPGKPTKTGPAPSSPGGATKADLALTLDVEPRKPRLAWQGMDRREASVWVPTQIVEIVRPGKAVTTEDKLPGITAAQQTARAHELPPNRLIWTNDNLVALRTLLDERHPVTRDHRYRGKVDLVYIDPPFMVQGDFLADNSIDIELDEDEHVEAKKEPSLVEILAYKDTWRQGLDSFLSMLRERLLLLKDLLAPTGSIYVHLDWHTVHYVKVLMDEVFGYENFKNEIVWQRTSSHNDPGKYGMINDSLLFYSASDAMFWGDPWRVPPASYFDAHDIQTDQAGRLFRARDLTAPHLRFGETGKPWRGLQPAAKGRCWSVPVAELDELDRKGMIIWPQRGEWPRLKVYLSDDRGIPIQSIWSDISPVNSQAGQRLGYPTQKPVALLERIVAASCPPSGLVLDCFVGSGTTAEAAERLGRRWVGIDNGKYAIHLTRKRLIQLHGKTRSPEKQQFDYVECDKCKNIERKEKPQKTRETFNVGPFTVENMGVYQRAEQWQDFQTQRSKYRDEMIKVFGGEVVNHSPLLHGRKGNSWVHVGPLDGPVSVAQVWSIAREAQKSERKAVTILSADFDTLSGSEKDEIKSSTGVSVVVRIIPASAIDEVRRRLDIQRSNPDIPIESMAIPAFYAPLSIILSQQVSGRMAKVTLDRCEIDIESFIASQRPLLKAVTPSMSATAKKKLKGEIDKWESRQKELEKWLAKATSWQKFVDFWAVDWEYGRRVGPDDKPIFETDWQSFRVRRSKGEVDPLVLTAEYKYEQPGHYRVAARVTDVFGNDGIATVTMEVK